MLPDLPYQIPVDDLDIKHPEYVMFEDTWKKLEILYNGMPTIRNRASEILTQRVKEHTDIYQSRIDNLGYTPLLANVIGWYVSSIFAKQPEVLYKIANEDDAEKAQNNVPADVAEFLEDFQLDCDRRQTGMVDKFREVLETTSVYGATFQLIDLPYVADAQTLAEQQLSGALNPILINYDPLCVLNWANDDYGNIDWIKIRIKDFITDPVGKTQNRTCWYIFTRQDVTAYEFIYLETLAGMATRRDSIAKRMDGYPRKHAMSVQNRVPVRRITAPEGMWLGRRIVLQLLKHFNMENALDWQIWQSALAMLAIFGPYEEQPTLTEVGYLQFPAGTEAKWLEPEGKSMEIHRHRLSETREEVYRSCYLMDQARSNKATPSAQSGISKEMDKTPSRDAQDAFGDMLIAAMNNAINDALAIRSIDGIDVEIRGFDFADKNTAELLDIVSQAKTLNIQSDTFDKELDNMTVMAVFPDADPAIQQKMSDEIKNAPTKTERDAQEMAAQQQGFSQAISSYSN